MRAPSICTSSGTSSATPASSGVTGVRVRRVRAHSRCSRSGAGSSSRSAGHCAGVDLVVGPVGLLGALALVEHGVAPSTMSTIGGDRGRLGGRPRPSHVARRARRGTGSRMLPITTCCCVRQVAARAVGDGRERSSIASRSRSSASDRATRRRAGRRARGRRALQRRALAARLDRQEARDARRRPRRGRSSSSNTMKPAAPSPLPDGVAWPRSVSGVSSASAGQQRVRRRPTARPTISRPGTGPPPSSSMTSRSGVPSANSPTPARTVVAADRAHDRAGRLGGADARGTSRRRRRGSRGRWRRSRRCWPASAARPFAVGPAISTWAADRLPDVVVGVVSTTSSTPRRYGGAMRGNGGAAVDHLEQRGLLAEEVLLGPVDERDRHDVGSTRPVDLGDRARRPLDLARRTTALVATITGVGADGVGGDRARPRAPRTGRRRMIARSLKEPGSPSAALTTTVDAQHRRRSWRRPSATSRRSGSRRRRGRAGRPPRPRSTSVPASTARASRETLPGTAAVSEVGDRAEGARGSTGLFRILGSFAEV